MAVRKRTEFRFAVAHRPGELARVLKRLAAAGVNVLGFVGYALPDGAFIHIVPDNDATCAKTLAAAGYKAETGPIVCLTGASGKGAGAKVAEKLAKANINLEHAYATTSGSGQSTAVFRVGDADKALKALK